MPKYNVGDTIIEIYIGDQIYYYDQNTDTYFLENPSLYLNPVDAIQTKQSNYFLIGIFLLAFILIK